MTNDSIKHHRRSIRLKHYDYSQPGAYFITMCTFNKECILGNVINGGTLLNEFGRIVETEWLKSGQIRKNVELVEYIVMPNHFHGILVIDSRGVLPYAPPYALTQLRSPSQTAGAIIRGFKSAVTKQVNQLRNTPGKPVWQRNYYEHIIRNEGELNNTREYILNNPLRWEYDRENPNGKPDEEEKRFWKNFR